MKKLWDFFVKDDSTGLRVVITIGEAIGIIAALVILAKLNFFIPSVVAVAIMLILVFGNSVIYWRGRRDGRREMMEDDD